jgi:hypothetical protein
MLPPMSVPHPTTEPCKFNSVPSPPVDPPGVNSGLRGCVVSPHNGLSVSHHCRDGELDPVTVRDPQTNHDALG